MSADAERYVETLSLKGSARELLRVIATHIPEGQTTTPILRIADLATQAQLHRRTVHRWIGELIDSREVTVLDGGRGKKARFTLVHLTGARPLVTAPLPLRADLRPVPRPRLDDQTRDLFAPAGVAVVEGEDPAIKRMTNDHTLADNVWRSITRWSKRVTNDHTLVLPLDVAGTRARDVQQLKTTTTTTATPADAPRFKWPPCRWHGTVHAWCEGREHVPMAFHLEERRKLARRPGETDADLDAQLYARYTAILAAIPESEEIRDASEFKFWNRVMRSTTRDGVPLHASPPVHRDIYAEAEEQRRQRRGGR